MLNAEQSQKANDLGKTFKAMSKDYHSEAV